jgi:TPR repeat protein
MVSCGSLGAQYYVGDDVERSDQRAIELFRQGCDGGDLYSCLMLDEI